MKLLVGKIYFNYYLLIIFFIFGHVINYRIRVNCHVSLPHFEHRKGDMGIMVFLNQPVKPYFLQFFF